MGISSLTPLLSRPHFTRFFFSLFFFQCQGGSPILDCVWTSFFFSLSLTLIFFVFFFSLIPSLICRSAVFKSRSLGMQEDSPFRRRKTRQPQGTTGPQSDFSVGAMWISRRTCGRSGACWRNYWRGRCNSAGLGCQTSFGPSLCFLGSPRTRL